MNSKKVEEYNSETFFLTRGKIKLLGAMSRSLLLQGDASEKKRSKRESSFSDLAATAVRKICMQMKERRRGFERNDEAFTP